MEILEDLRYLFEWIGDLLDANADGIDIAEVTEDSNTISTLSSLLSKKSDD